MIYIEELDNSFSQGFFEDLNDLFEYLYTEYENVNKDNVGEDMVIPEEVLPKHFSTCTYKIDEEYPLQNIIEEGGDINDSIYYVYYPNKDQNEIKYPDEIIELFREHENTNKG